MPVVLYRIDERLIHGQVIVGWGAQLRPDRVVVADDDLVDADWEQELYGLGLPAEIAAEFVSVETARNRLHEWRAGTDRVILLTRTIQAMGRLAGGGLLSGEEVNIGGVHHAPDRHRVLPYVYLSPLDGDDLRQLEAEGVAVSARDVPSARRVGLDHLLEAP